MFYLSVSSSDPITKLTEGFLGEFNIWTILIRILLTFILAGIIGFERANKRHSAGLRTFILVSLSGCVAGLIDSNLEFPIISCAIVIAVAIVSANTLLYSSKSQIKGLTTAVALWANVFTGLCFGLGLYTIAIITFILLIFALSVLPTLEVYLKNRSNHFEIHLELKNKTDLIGFTTTIRKLGLKIDDIEANPAYINSGLSVYTISLTISSNDLKKYKTHAEIIEALKSLEYVNCIEEIN